MQEIDNKIHTGKITSFRGQFGFIESELGDTFFHKTGLKSVFLPKRNDEVEFKIKSSQKKAGKSDAYEIVLVKKAEQIEDITAVEEYILGTVKWFDGTKGYGFISADDKNDYFIHKSNLLFTTYISEGDFVVFCEKIHNGKLSANKCQPFISGLNNCSSENQYKLLNNYSSKFDYINSSNLQLIKSIAQSDKIAEIAKATFLKSAFERASPEYQFKMLVDDLISISEQEQIEFLQKYLFELGSISYSNYDRIESIAQLDKIAEISKATFLKSAFERASTECQFKMLIDDLISISEQEQNEFLQKYLFELGSISYSNYDRIKSIAKSDKVKERVKGTFLKSAFESASAEYQYKMLFDDSLIDIQKETSESQIELLQNLERLDIDKIKSISQSDKVEETAKDAFLKSAFENASAEYQYKMLFDDNLIDIQKETSESQIELLRKLERLDTDKIKSISQSDKIEETVKDAFLKSAFDKATAECQYKLLFDDCLVQDISKKLDFLLITTQSGRMKFSKGQYGGETYFEVLENDIEYLHKNKNKQNSDIEEFYDVKFGYWSYDGGRPNEYNLSSKYEEWKESWCFILDEVNTEIENQNIFANDSTEELYKKITQINEARELFDIFGIGFNENDFKNAINNAIVQLDFDFLVNIGNYKLLACVKKYNSEFYNTLFEQNYHQITKIKRLRLWLQNLNPYYHYLELVQSAWQLSNDERKLLNKRIKEHAKDERLQKFIDQIPIAELIEKTESTKTYKCKWRNLYYKNGSIQVFFDKSTSSEDYIWESAREEWNLLTQEYFNNRRIDDIITTVNSNNHITKIAGLEDIEVKIVIAEVRKNGATDRKTNISSSQISKIIHNISARNQCINFLASQNSDYNVLDIQELVTDDYGSLRRDVSFIFPIPNGKGNVYLIWESAEFEKSKATHIFKCSEEELEDMESKIKDFIECNLRTRSRLNSVENEDLEVKREMQYFCRVNHDSVEYQVWENRMREVLPFLK
jgi:cold shock CspA family protein